MGSACSDGYSTAVKDAGTSADSAAKSDAAELLLRIGAFEAALSVTRLHAGHAGAQAAACALLVELVDCVAIVQTSLTTRLVPTAPLPHCAACPAADVAES